MFTRELIHNLLYLFALVCGCDAKHERKHVRFARALKLNALTSHLYDVICVAVKLGYHLLCV